MGKISSRPRSISADSTILEKSDRKEKFSIGPTRFMPGPMLLMQVDTADTAVPKSISSREISRNDAITSPRYRIR